MGCCSFFLLIGFKHGEAKARAAAWQALLVTGGGGLALFAGLLLMGTVVGSFDLRETLDSGSVLREHPWYPVIVSLVLLGAFTKSAQFPFHFWLPNAMTAPTPVSAYLHSATMVKAGVFLLVRFTPSLGDTALWMGSLTIFGGITLVGSGLMGLVQNDLKRMLAYSTVSALGILTVLIGLGNETALWAAVVFLLGHALYKATLFLTVGVVDHCTGTRDLSQLGGLAKVLPLTALAAALAALSQAGLPPFLGFIAKESVYEAAFGEAGWSWAVVAVLLVGNACFTAIAVLAGGSPYWRGKQGVLTHGVGQHWLLNAAPLLLGGFGLLLGLVPVLVSDLTRSAASAALGGELSGYLALWHGLNLPLLLSTLTLVLGIFLLWGRSHLQAIAVSWGRRVAASIGPTAVYERGFRGLLGLSVWLTRLLQNGYLRCYLLFLLLGMGVLIAASLLPMVGLSLLEEVLPVRIHELGIIVLMLASTAMAISTSSRLSAIAALSVVGYGVAVIYLLYGAPDLAITQVLIETLTLILLVIVVHRLPKLKVLSKQEHRLRDVVISIVFGEHF